MVLPSENERGKMQEAMLRGDALDAINGKKRKRTKGRQKIEIKAIKCEAQRQVSFSKRRSGLFKKAFELSVLCGAHVAAIVFSPANKPFSYIHPSVPSVLDRYISSQSSQPHYYSQDQLLNHASTSDASVPYLSSQLAELTAVLEAAKSRKEALKERLQALEGNAGVDGDMSKLGWTELNDLRMQLERVKADVLARAGELCRDSFQFMDEIGIQSNAGYGYGFPSNDGVMLPDPPAYGFVSDYAVPQMPTYFGYSYDGQMFV